MRGATDLNGDARGREALEERDHVPAPQLSAQDGSLRGVNAVELEDVFGRVHADATNLLHGRPPHVRSATTSPWHSDAVRGAVHTIKPVPPPGVWSPRAVGSPGGPARWEQPASTLCLEHHEGTCALTSWPRCKSSRKSRRGAPVQGSASVVAARGIWRTDHGR